MSHDSPSAASVRHALSQMTGRDPHEPGRSATALELLFDLTFVIAFGMAANELAHALSAGHLRTALVGFGFASFAICWAWINFSWFASAFDTDDWEFRVVTMVQMLGVLVVALGLPRMFRSIEHGEHFDTTVIVMGYVVMRLAMVFQWLRAARQSPRHRRACRTYAAAISIAQLGWIALILMNLSVGATLGLAVGLALVEMAGPVLAERMDGGTPWHAHHIAERYGLFAIIALGEGVVGTVATLSAVVESQGWTLDAVFVGLSGLGLTFGMWWIYFIVPSAAVLHRHRDRSFVWGYGQMVIVAAIVATGAGLHVAATYLEGKSHIGSRETLLAVAVPVAVYMLLIYALYSYMMRRFNTLKVWLSLATAAVIAIAIVCVGARVSMPVSLFVLTLAPVVSVVGYEVWGHRQHQEALLRNESGNGG